MKLTSIPKSHDLSINVASKRLDLTDLKRADTIIREFLANWNTHGQKIEAIHWWIENQILCIATNQSGPRPTGCSLDSKNHLIQSLEKEFDIVLNDNSKFRALIDGEIQSFSRAEFIDAYKIGNLSGDSTVINTLCTSTNNLEEELFPKLKNSWHYRLVS